MTGIELFHLEAKKKNFSIGQTDVSKGEANGNFTMTNSAGKTTTQNFKRISEIYGTLVFFHFSPEQAMAELFEMIETQMQLDAK